MMEELFRSFVKSAQVLGELPPASIWAFVAIVEAVYIFNDKRNQTRLSDKAWNARIKEAQADTLMATALEKVCAEVREIRNKVGK